MKQRMRIIMKINIFAVLDGSQQAAVSCCWCLRKTRNFSFDEVYLSTILIRRLMKANSVELRCVNLFSLSLTKSSNTPIDLCAFLVKCFDSNGFFLQLCYSIMMYICNAIIVKTVFTVQVVVCCISKQLLSIKSSILFPQLLF